MSKNVKAEWWLTSVDCDTCLVTIRKHHIARHKQSKMHKRLEGKKYRILPSDIAFTNFLAGVRGAYMTGIEETIYHNARREAA